MDDSVGLPVLVEGFRRAVARFEGVAYDKDVGPAETYIPLFEALNWAASIGWRVGDARSDLLRALEWVRNAVHHEWADALVATPRAYGEGAYGAGSYGGHIWRWKSSDGLGSSGERRQLYDELVAERPAISTLTSLLLELERTP